MTHVWLSLTASELWVKKPKYKNTKVTASETLSKQISPSNLHPMATLKEKPKKKNAKYYKNFINKIFSNVHLSKAGVHDFPIRWLSLLL